MRHWNPHFNKLSRWFSGMLPLDTHYKCLLLQPQFGVDGWLAPRFKRFSCKWSFEDSQPSCSKSVNREFLAVVKLDYISESLGVLKNHPCLDLTPLSSHLTDWVLVDAPQIILIYSQVWNCCIGKWFTNLFPLRTYGSWQQKQFLTAKENKEKYLFFKYIKLFGVT